MPHVDVWILVLLCAALTSAQSFSDCLNVATAAVANADCPVGPSEARTECVANIMTPAVLPCFREASQLDLVHLLVPEIEERFVMELRNAASNYLEFSGQEIIIHSIPTEELLPTILSFFALNDVFYSGWLVPSWTLPFIHDASPLLDVAGNLTDDVAFDWPDVSSNYRTNMIVLEDSVVGVPVGGDLQMLYYRRDIFEAQNISQPTTWEEVLILAEQYNDTDLNNDGLPDYGTCLSNHTSDGSRATWIKAIMGPYFQYLGDQQGILFDADSMEPLVDNDAMAWILDLYKELASFGPYSQPHISDIRAEDLFSSGRCLMTISGVEIFHRHGQGAIEDTIGVAELPGSWYVYDRSSQSLSRCTNMLCPHGRADRQGAIINFTPYDGPCSLVAVVNSMVSKTNREELFNFLSHLGGKSLSFELITAASHIAPFRWSHLQVDRWVERGWNYNAALDYINAMSRSFVSANVLWEPRLPAELRVDEALEEAGDRLIRSEAEVAAVLKDLEALLREKVESYGRGEVLHRVYRTSLHLKPLQDSESEAKDKSSGGFNTWALVLGLCLPLSLLAFCTLWCNQLCGSAKSLRHKRPARPPLAGPQTSLVITDIQDSTTLWETLDADVMDEALQLHNQCLRDMLRQNNGYESATEGDSFIIAFHSAYDAVVFCYEAQLALLEVDWPEEIFKSSIYSSVSVRATENSLKVVTDKLLARRGSTLPAHQQMETQMLETVEGGYDGHFQGPQVTTRDLEVENLVPHTEGGSVTSEEEISLFRGLRVRMGVFTGVQSASDVMMNNASRRMMYSGMSMAMAKAVSDVGCGGQIVIAESTFRAMGLEKLIDRVHVLHLGEYTLSDTLPQTQFFEIVEKRLVSRLLYFPVLKAEGLSPPWYDAPSGVVCICFCFVVGAETLSQWNNRIFREALHIYESLAKKWLQHFRGYLVEAADGLFLAAFSESSDAVLWGLTLHHELTTAPWYPQLQQAPLRHSPLRPSELLKHPLCEKMSMHSVDQSGCVHLKDVMGFRVKTGVESGPAKCNPHQTTGFMAYRGKVINRAARITKLASGGQVYTSGSVCEAAQQSPDLQSRGVKCCSMGTQKLKVRV